MVRALKVSVVSAKVPTSHSSSAVVSAGNAAGGKNSSTKPTLKANASTPAQRSVARGERKRSAQRPSSGSMTVSARRTTSSARPRVASGTPNWRA